MCCYPWRMAKAWLRDQQGDRAPHERRSAAQRGHALRNYQASAQDDFIEESDERPDFSLDDERRRYYRLTKLGNALAEAEAERMERVLGMARAKRILGPENA